MSDAGYTKDTLIGNWFEERLALPQPRDDFPEVRTLRPHDASLLFESNHGPKLLTRMKRMLPYKSYALSDYGFNEKQTTNLSDYTQPDMGKYLSNTHMTIINNASIAEISNSDRRPTREEAKALQTDILTPVLTENMSYMTTNRASFGCNNVSSLIENKRRLHHEYSERAGTYRAKDSHSRFVNLVGERVRGEECDASVQTSVGKTWLPTKDAGYSHVMRLVKGESNVEKGTSAVFSKSAGCVLPLRGGCNGEFYEGNGTSLKIGYDRKEVVYASEKEREDRFKIQSHDISRDVDRRRGGEYIWKDFGPTKFTPRK